MGEGGAHFSFWVHGSGPDERRKKKEEETVHTRTRVSQEEWAEKQHKAKNRSTQRQIEGKRQRSQEKGVQESR